MKIQGFEFNQTTKALYLVAAMYYVYAKLNKAVARHRIGANCLRFLAEC